MANYVFPATDFIGGTTGCADAIDGNDLTVGDAVIVRKAGYSVCYIVTTSTLAENSPWVITPDSNPGTKRLIAIESAALQVIRSNTTRYIATTGDDTGLGTSGDPWLTLGKATSWLRDKIIPPDVTVTIEAGSGTFAFSSPEPIIGSQYSRVDITGQGSTGGSATIFSGSASSVGVLLIEGSTSLKDLRNIKLAGDGTNGNGLEITANSACDISADVLIDNFNTGILSTQSSALTATSASLTCSNCNSYGVYANKFGFADAPSCVFDNNTQGVRAAASSTIRVPSATISNNTTGAFATLFSYIIANGVTWTSNTTDADPTRSTANDPTFDNIGSAIYG